MSSGENRNRREPEGEENGTNSSQTLTNAKQLSQRSRHFKAASKHVQEDVNLSDDSLEDDGPEIAAASTSRDGERNNTQTHSRDSVARNSSHSNQHKRTIGNPPSHSGTTSPVHSTTLQQHINSDNVRRSAQGSAKSSQVSSRVSSCTSKIPVLKRPKVKPSPLVEASKASLSSVASGRKYPPSSKQTEDGSDTPVSIPIDEVPISDCLNHDKQPVVSHDREEQAAVTIQAYYRGWSTRKANRNKEIKPEVQPQQDKRHRKLRNANSFNSYVHEQMAITMAMMEANFEGVGLSHRQQERVEELRAGLDSFSLTNIAATMAEQQHEPHPQTIHDHWDNNKPSSNNRNENRKRIHGNAGIEMTHGGMRTKLLYKSRSYDTSYHEDTSHKSDWLGDKRHGSYLQQEGSYLQQAKVAQSIKSLRPPKLKPLPRRQSSNYLQNYIKSNKGSVSRNSRQWSPAHLIPPPIDESTPVSHVHWNSAMIRPRDHMTYDSYHYPVLPNIGDSYSTISLHPAVKSFKSYQQHWPGPSPPQPSYRTHTHHPQRGNCYTQHRH